jgi:Ca-activated chloride channel family protein
MTTPQIVIMTDAEVDRLTVPSDEKGCGALMTPRGPLPLKILDAHTKIEGLLVETSLVQTFANTHQELLEATYVFPLPDRAAVTRFRLEVAGRVVEGVLKERTEARQEYEQALRAGHRAAIMEEERPGVFTMRIGNLPAGETATVRLTLVGPVVYDSGEVTFRFPLVVAPRYIPGVPLTGGSVGAGWASDTDAVPDASRITPPVLLPGYPYPVGLSLTVDVAGTDLAAEGFRSSLHAVTSETIGGATRITVQPGERVNRDFILRYRLGEATIGACLSLVPDAASAQEGTFVLTVLPGHSQVKPQATRPRDVVFVLDRSGSMAGWKMVAARRALGRMIETLTEQDRFIVYAFDDIMEMPPAHGAELVQASDRNRFRAVEWLGTIDARGGTEMAYPLDQAVQRLSSDRDRVLVLLTDGQVGNEDQILQVLGKRLKDIRIFTLGVDRAVNEAFLRRLAALGGGSCDVVESEDRLDAVMGKVQRRIGSPQWTALQIEARGLQIEADSQVPARLPDLFAGVPLVAYGRYRGAPKGDITLQATDDAGQPSVQTIAARPGVSSAAAHLWARGRLRDLEDRWVVGGEESPAELEKRIVALSLKFGVLCRFTAFVAVDRTEVVNPGGEQMRLIQPVEPVDGWDMLKAPHLSQARFKCSSPLPAMPMMLAQADQEESCSDDAELCQFDEEPRSSASMHAGGLVARIRHKLGAMFARSEESAELPSESDRSDALEAYRQRAREMLEALDADSDKGHALGVLAVKLQALLEDLKSIGADAEVLKPLAELLSKVEAARGTAPLQLDQLTQQLTAQAQSVLGAFAGRSVSPA